MNKKRKKCIIGVKDILNITNMSERYAQEKLHQIREYFKKEKHQFITVKEFSIFSGIPVEDIEEYL